jgi:predicted nucleic-acid-binding protein
VIAVDTNVLVRYFIEDDLSQSRKVDALLAQTRRARTRLHVDDVVLCELVWVLDYGYGFEKSTIVNALDRILSTVHFSFVDRELLRQTLVDYAAGSGDFPDYLIGRRNERAGCEATVTFDRALRDNPSFRVL